MARKPARIFGRRLAMSCLAALVAMAATTTAFGASASGGGDAESSVSFAPTPVRIGDVATYAGAYQSGSSVVMAIGWANGTRVLMPDGTWFESDAVTQTFTWPNDPDNFAERHGLVYEAGTGHQLQQTVAFDMDIADATYLVPGLVGTRTFFNHSSEEARFVDRVAPPCLFGGFAGISEIRSDAPLVLGPCASFMMEVVDADGILQPLGQTPDGAALRFLLETAEPVQSWHIDLAPGVAYPIRIGFAAPEEHAPSGVMEYALTALVPGTAPRAIGEVAASAGPKPVLQWKARTSPLLLDDAGMDIPLTLAEAFAAARDDVQNTGLRDFLDEHADAVVVVADYLPTRTTGGARSLMWSFVIRGGDEEQIWRVTRSRPNDIHVTPNPLPWVTQVSGPQETDIFPDVIAVAPQRVPTAESLLGRAAWAGSYDYEETTQGCYGYGPTWLDGGLHYFAGSCLVSGTLSVSPTGPALVNSRFEAGGFAILGADGTDRGTRYSTDFQAFTDGGDGIVYDADAPPGQAPAQGQTPTRTRWTPTPAQAAEIGLAGILAGVAAFLWPTLKAGVLALFSRVEGPAVAQHPTRARLLAAIQAQPGTHFRGLQRATGESNGNLVYHLGRLEMEGLIRKVSQAGYSVYLPAGATKGPLVAAHSPGAQRILDAAREHPGTGLHELARHTGLGASTVHHHLARLEAAGAIRVDRSGSSLQVTAAV